MYISASLESWRRKKCQCWCLGKGQNMSSGNIDKDVLKTPSQVILIEKGLIQSHGTEGLCPLSLPRFLKRLIVVQVFPHYSWARIKKRPSYGHQLLGFPFFFFYLLWNIHLDNLILLPFHAQLCTRTTVSGINKVIEVFLFISCQVIPPCFTGDSNNKLNGYKMLNI